MANVGKPVAFRPVQRVRERLELAQKAGLDVSKMINDILDEDDRLADRLRDELLDKEAQLSEVRNSLTAKAA